MEFQRNEETRERGGRSQGFGHKFLVVGNQKRDKERVLETKSEGLLTERMRKGRSKGGGAEYFGDIGVLGFVFGAWDFNRED